MVPKQEESIIIGETTIRRATPEDAAGIANAHLNSWREAYRGMISQDYLDSLPLTFKSRMEYWAKFATLESAALYVADAKPGIVGFGGFRPSKEDEFREYGEVGAIYLLEKFKNKGIGAALLTMGLQQIARWNFSKAYCWVLKDNPTIKFYEKSGANFSGIEKEDEIGGAMFKELAYQWQNLDRYKS